MSFEKGDVTGRFPEEEIHGFTKQLDKVFKSFREMSLVVKDNKTDKAIRDSTKMFKAIKEGKDAITETLNAFLSAGTASDVFSDVVSSFSAYLSDTFWAGVLQGIDFTLLTTAIQDLIAPVFEDMGTFIGAVIEEDPELGLIGALIGNIIGSFFQSPELGTVIGGFLGAMIQSFFTDLFIHLGFLPPEPTPAGDRTVEDLQAEILRLETVLGNLNFLDPFDRQAAFNIQTQIAALQAQLATLLPSPFQDGRGPGFGHLESANLGGDLIGGDNLESAQTGESPNALLAELVHLNRAILADKEWRHR